MTTATPDSSTQAEQVPQLCRMLAILTLRHEDALNALACQDQCVLFLTHGTRGVTQLLIQAAQDWKEQTTNTSPLRVVLMRTLMEELIRRFKSFCTKLSDAEFRRNSIQTKVILEDGTILTFNGVNSRKVLRYEESEQYNGSDALEDPVGHAERPADVRNEGPSRLSSVDARCWTVESPLTTA
ncbi:unnamed protein product, partial [Durusdinium trenchii]